MIRSVSRYFIACLGQLLAAAALFSVAYSQPGPEPNREHLLNGLTVLHYQRTGDPNVLIKLRINSGAAFDLAGRAGEMALLADAFFPDPATREYVSEQLGGRLEVTTTYDAIEISVSGKNTDLERLLDLVRNAILTINLSAESVARLREARIKTLSDKLLSPAQVADQAVAARLFGNFPYGRPESGTPESVAKVERADLMLARERFLNADNGVLVVVGGVDKARLMRDLRQLLGPWQKSDKTVPATFRAPNPPDARVLLIKGPDAHAQVRLAVRGLAKSDRDAMAANVVAQIFRERWQAAAGEISSAFARHQAYILPGMFVAGAEVPATQAGKALSTAEDVMRSLTQNPVTTAELERARAQVSQIMSPASEAEGLADALIDVEVYKAPSNRNASLSSVTPAELQRVATRLFKDQVAAKVVVGDVEQLKTLLGTNVEVPGDKPTKNVSTPQLPPQRP
jgi:zinc protease